MLYDGTCAVALLPYSYPEKLEKLGIACKMFAPLRPFVSTHYNYRDHRKIMVIDGKIGFTGGINLSDEYINRTSRLGHWKDTAIALRGDAVRSRRMKRKRAMSSPMATARSTATSSARWSIWTSSTVPTVTYTS